MHAETPTTNPARILVTGSRDFTDGPAVARVLDTAAQLLGTPASAQPTLVHGAARGLDTLAGETAAGLGWTVEAHPAQWNTHTDQCPAWHLDLPTCKMAGHRRNHEMIALGADVVLGFPTGTKDSGQSRGTWGCVDAAVRAGLPVLVYWNKTLWPAEARSAALVGGDPAAGRYDVLCLD